MKNETKEKVYNFKVEPFNARIEVIFTNNIVESRNNRIEKFGYPDNFGTDEEDLEVVIGALCACAYPNFGLFYNTNELRVDYITHETFHLTHAIFNAINQGFRYTDHETFAYLNGYLNRQIFGYIDKNKYKITL